MVSLASAPRSEPPVLSYALRMEMPITRDEVSLREFRNHLGRHLARVREGMELVVTDRGRPIAYISPSARSAWMDEMIAAGRITPPRTYRRSMPEPAEFHGTDEDLDRIVRESR